MLAALVVVPFFVPNGLVDQFYRCSLGFDERRFQVRCCDIQRLASNVTVVSKHLRGNVTYLRHDREVRQTFSAIVVIACAGTCATFGAIIPRVD